MPHAYLFQMEPLTRQVFWASYLVWCAMEVWIFSRDRRAAAGQGKDRGSFFVIVVLITAGSTNAFWAPHLWPWARIALPTQPLFWMAIALIWIGIALRIWAVLTLGRHFRIAVRILDEHTLVTHGPYRYLRHPSYTGGLLTLSGVGLAFGNWISFGGAFLSILLGYGLRILVEEAALRERFGDDFEAHRKRTWAIIPWLW